MIIIHQTFFTKVRFIFLHVIKKKKNNNKDLTKRLKNRNTDSNEKILERFHTAYKEINEVTKYNYVVVNDELDDAIDKVESILKAEKCRVDRIEEVYLDTKEEEIHELLMDEDFENESLSEKID